MKIGPPKTTERRDPIPSWRQKDTIIRPSIGRNKELNDFSALLRSSGTRQAIDRAREAYLAKYTDENSKVCDIYSKGEYPANALSNFYPHEFTVDGVKCNSMEGFLQSIKFRTKRAQKRVCLLVGTEAKEAGARKKRWKKTGCIYWQGKLLFLRGYHFYALLLRAYSALNRNEHFRTALEAAKGNILAHSIGNDVKAETILTRKEFLGLLYDLLEKNDKKQEGKDNE